MGLIRDPRIMQILLLLIYAVVGGIFIGFDVTWVQYLVTLAVCLVLETYFNYLKGKKVSALLSSMITALGIALALRGTTVIPFILAAVLAISLKHILRYRGSHIFNPSNSGVVIVSLLFPMAAATDPLQWGYFPVLLGLISLGGLFLVYKVHRLPLVSTFLVSFIGIQEIRHLIWSEALTTKFAAFMWGGLFVFTFNMITDPKTSPKELKGQLLFGFGIALIAQILIQFQIHGALFISLAVMCIIQFLIKFIRQQKKETTTFEA